MRVCVCFRVNRYLWDLVSVCASVIECVSLSEFALLFSLVFRACTILTLGVTPLSEGEVTIKGCKVEALGMVHEHLLESKRDIITD